MTRPTAETGYGRSPSGALFWLSAVGGWSVIGYGFRGLLQHHIDTRPRNLAGFLVAGAVVHDLVVAPAVLVVGVTVARAVPGRRRAILQAALMVSGCLALFSYPLVRGYGHALHNPGSLPHNYAANVSIVLGVVWGLVTAAVLLTGPGRQRRSSRC